MYAEAMQAAKFSYEQMDGLLGTRSGPNYKYLMYYCEGIIRACLVKAGSPSMDERYSKVKFADIPMKRVSRSVLHDYPLGKAANEP